MRHRDVATNDDVNQIAHLHMSFRNNNTPWLYDDAWKPEPQQFNHCPAMLCKCMVFVAVGETTPDITLEHHNPQMPGRPFDCSIRATFLKHANPHKYITTRNK